jgi:hypothetical protein
VDVGVTKGFKRNKNPVAYWVSTSFATLAGKAGGLDLELTIGATELLVDSFGFVQLCPPEVLLDQLSHVGLLLPLIFLQPAGLRGNIGAQHLEKELDHRGIFEEPPQDDFGDIRLGEKVFLDNIVRLPDLILRKMGIDDVRDILANLSVSFGNAALLLKPFVKGCAGPGGKEE